MDANTPNAFPHIVQASSGPDVHAPQLEPAADVLHSITARTRSELAAIRDALVAAEIRVEVALAANQDADQQAMMTAVIERAVEERTATLRDEATAAVLSRAEMETELEELQNELRATRSDARQQHGAFQNAVAELRCQYAEALANKAAEQAAQPLEALTVVFEALGATVDADDIVSQLIAGLSGEFSRVALFRVQANRLVGVDQTGFDVGPDISKLMIPLNVDSLLTRALRSDRVELWRAGQEGGLLFGGDPTCAIAASLPLDGSASAVVYADDANRSGFTNAVPNLIAFAGLVVSQARLQFTRVQFEQQNMAMRRHQAPAVSALSEVVTPEGGAPGQIAAAG